MLNCTKTNFGLPVQDNCITDYFMPLLFHKHTEHYVEAINPFSCNNVSALCNLSCTVSSNLCFTYSYIKAHKHNHIKKNTQIEKKANKQCTHTTCE